MNDYQSQNVSNLKMKMIMHMLVIWGRSFLFICYGIAYIYVFGKVASTQSSNVYDVDMKVFS